MDKTRLKSLKVCFPRKEVTVTFSLICRAGKDNSHNVLYFKPPLGYLNSNFT